jgi:hypothetical protein
MRTCARSGRGLPALGTWPVGLTINQGSNHVIDGSGVGGICGGGGGDGNATGESPAVGESKAGLNSSASSSSWDVSAGAAGFQGILPGAAPAPSASHAVHVGYGVSWDAGMQRPATPLRPPTPPIGPLHASEGQGGPSGRPHTPSPPPPLPDELPLTPGAHVGHAWHGSGPARRRVVASTGAEAETHGRDRPQGACSRGQAAQHSCSSRAQSTRLPVQGPYNVQIKQGSGEAAACGIHRGAAAGGSVSGWEGSAAGDGEEVVKARHPQNPALGAASSLLQWAFTPSRPAGHR